MVNILAEFGQVEIWHHFKVRSLGTHPCAEANPDTWEDCVCVCEGQHHGYGPPGAAAVGDGNLLVEHTPQVRYWVVRQGGRFSPHDTYEQTGSSETAA